MQDETAQSATPATDASTSATPATDASTSATPATDASTSATPAPADESVAKRAESEIHTLFATLRADLVKLLGFDHNCTLLAYAEQNAVNHVPADPQA